MDREEVLGNMHPAHRANAEMIREYTTRAFECVDDPKSGLPELKSKLEAAGFKIVVEVSVKPNQDEATEVVEKPKSHGEKHPPSRADLKAAEEMGMSIADIESVEAQEDKTAYEAVLADLREKAPKLVPRVRRNMCSWASHTFPELNILVPDVGYFEKDPDGKRWLQKLGELTTKIMTLPDSQKHLDTLLGRMERLQYLPASGIGRAPSRSS